MIKKLLFLLLFLSFSLSPSFSATTVVTPVSHIHPVQQVVYITKTGTKYHKGTCHYLKKSKIEISKSDAKSAGYTACSVCNP
ncbi:hypothetical protein [Aequorivita lipolytica]|uniref:Ada DNA repair metal-binding domain-containing protein n=1 Tax=Aequorivita lipolytica TaxID=153267 RepID=A0A5C6YKN8_9FLAO|nr:hypothetical protein [Aequorivita lipolytica]TXD67792.1 hypothetical protein ESV24_15100 [Aequorivita lipolytica]